MRAPAATKDLGAALGSALARHPLAWAVVAGALARGLAAVVGIGFHARDDYFHVLEPALHWLADPGFDWDDSSVPGAGIRSHLVPRLVWLLLRALQGLGVHEPESLLRGIYLVFGAYSLLVVPATFLLAGRLLSRRGTLVATWLAALHFAMPYVGTRLLIEAMAMPPLVFGLYLATFAGTWRVVAAGLFVGLACWFRFQTGVAAVGVAVAVLLHGAREGGWRDGVRRAAALGVGGAAAVTLQGLFDLATTGGFLQPVLRNIQYNLDPPAGMTSSNALSYVGTWLLLTVPPATVVVLPAMVRAARRLPLVTWPFVLFVLLHSFVAHKEERFMLPVLPLFLVLLAAVPDEIARGGGRVWTRLRAWWPPARAWLVGAHLVAVALAVTSQSQLNLRETMKQLRHDAAARGVLVVGPEVQSYFLARPRLPVRRASRLDAAWVRRTLDSLAADGVEVNRFVTFAQSEQQLRDLLAAMRYDCSAVRVLEGWWLDRVIHRLNPRHNRRRSPILVWSCERPAVAATSARPGSAPL